MENNYAAKSLQSPIAEGQYLPDFMNDPWHGNRFQPSLVHEIMQIEPTGHNTEQGSGSGSGLLLGIGGNRILEKGSGSGLPEANMVGTNVTTAETGRPGQKRNGKSKSAENSEKYRANKKVEMQRVHEENKRLQKKNKKLKKNQNESNRKLNDQLRKIRQLNARLARFQKDSDGQKIQINSLSKSIENISYLQEENRRLQADKDLLMQQVNAGTNAKKWVKIPLEDRKLKIEGNVLFLKMA